MKLLWAINVFDRIDHLHEQEDRLRAHFPDLDLYVFTNHPDLEAAYRETWLHRHPTNGGHHAGVLDAYNELARTLDIERYDWVVWSHADAIWSDYAIAERWLAQSLVRHVEVLTLGATHETNHRRHCTSPWAYQDFLACRPTAYRRLFPLQDVPRADDGDLLDPVEVVIGEAIPAAGLARQTIPAFYDWHERPHRFILNGTGIVSCDNDFVRTLQALGDHSCR